MIPPFSSRFDLLGTLTVVKRKPVVFALALAAALALVMISESAYWQSSATLADLVAMGAARARIESVDRGIVDAESAQHSYLLTGRADDLLAYDRALRDVDESLAYLYRYDADEAEIGQVLGQLKAASSALLTDFGATIRQRGQGPSAGRIALDEGEKIQAIRRLNAELLKHETRRVAQSRDELGRTLKLGRIGVVVLSVLSLIALLMVMRQTFALERQQREQQRLLQVERDRLEIEVKQRTLQLTQLAHHLQTAREDERNRLARDLHDELGALLTSAKLDAARIKSRLGASAPEALERLAHLVETLNSVIALKRRISEDLRPSALSNLGLVVTLEILAREFAERSGVEVSCDFAPVALAKAAELVVYRVMQEAINNISKYALAHHVWLSLGPCDSGVEATIRDDGVGFDTSRMPTSAYGLLGMRFRVEAEKGTLTMDAAPGQGTLIRVRLPPSGRAKG
jgi:signal transduction histidine kinase